MADKQRTLKQEATLKGHGLHTGLEATIKLLPAPANHGYKFQRIDLEGQPIITAVAENVVDTSRSTVIEENGARVGTIEHCLSGLSGMGVDNCLIQIDSPETPILDGSSQPYVNAIKEAGIVVQDENRNYFVVEKSITYQDEEHGIEIIAFPSDRLSMNVMIDYNSTVLGNQYAMLNSIDEYETEIAPCKTFVFLRELEVLLKNNLIKGGSLDNALVIMDREVSQEELDHLADLFNKPHISGATQGVLNAKDLIFQNEPARHKLLDLIGDLSLVGMPVKGKILATRPGHYSNVEFAKKIRQIIKKKSGVKLVPVDVDLDKTPVYNINDIKKMLPHRYPFLLVDKIMSVTETEIIGVKNVTVNEPFFNGHFPEEPVMPAVLQIEAMAQVGGIMVLSKVPDPDKYSTYFLKMDKIKFRDKVVPGDTLIFKLELIAPVRRGIVNMKAQAFVGQNLVSEGELMAQIVKNK